MMPKPQQLDKFNTPLSPVSWTRVASGNLVGNVLFHCNLANGEGYGTSALRAEKIHMLLNIKFAPFFFFFNWGLWNNSLSFLSCIIRHIMNYKLACNFFFFVWHMWLRLVFQFNNKIVWPTKKAEGSTSTQACRLLFGHVCWKCVHMTAPTLACRGSGQSDTLE